MTFAAEVLARESVCEFVNNLCGSQSRHHPGDIAGAEEFVKMRQSISKLIKLNGHETRREKDECHAQQHCGGTEDPADPGMEPCQKTIGVETWQSNPQNAEQSAEKLSSLSDVPPAQQLLALPAGV